MKSSQLTKSAASPLEKECKRLWQDVSNKLQQPKEFDLKSNVLEVVTDKGIVRHDFIIFEHEHYRFFESINIRVDEMRVSVTPIDLAKFMYLNLLQEQKPSSTFLYSVFNGICILFALMKIKNTQFGLNESDYKEYFGILFSFKPSLNGLIKRLAPQSYQGARIDLCLYKLIRLMVFLDMPYKFSRISEKLNQKMLSETCLEVMGITFEDYKRGGSFNFLGLEIGKHYVDHCASVMEEYFQTAYALRKTYSRVEEVCYGKKLPIHQSMKMRLVGQILLGESLPSAIKVAGYKNIEDNEKNFKDTYHSLLAEFRQQYEDCSALSSINKLAVISKIIEDARLPNRFDTIEFVRSMLMAEYINDWNKPSTAIFAEYVAALKSDNSYSVREDTLNLTHKEFMSICRQAVEKHSTRLSKNPKEISKFLKDVFAKAKFVPPSLSGVDALNRLCFSVESALCTLFAALTGWRRSEFGFPLSSLSATINIEVLDNLYTPWRFNVNWTVPKTHGDLKIDREITSYTYQIAYNASFLNLSGSEMPALYSGKFKSTSSSSSSSSSGAMNTRVGSLWIDFIKNYTLFNEATIDEYSELAEIKKRLNKELPSYEFSETSNKTLVLQRYREGTLDESTTKLLNTKLSARTKDFIMDESNEISIEIVLAVGREVIADIPFPTPHSFRHIWAEAVLTRYRGDVGKVIRANFKHMGGRFFMAYLRGKEMQAIYRIAERTVISKVVRQHFKNANEKYYDYTGGFQRYVAKVARKTKVFKPEDQVKVMEKVSDRVISIKSNLWVTCMLREGNQHRAKCAEDGIPQRRNAEPKFCLGCMHSDISEMNYEGIVLSIKDDVAACRNTELPTFIKTENAKTVQLALKRIKELKRNSGKTKYDKYIAHLEESLEMALWEPLKWSENK